MYNEHPSSVEFYFFTEDRILGLDFTCGDIDELHYFRFYHPDPMVMKRCDTVYLKSKGLKTGQIRELTGRNIKTIRAHLHLYKDGGIEALKRRVPYSFGHRVVASVTMCEGHTMRSLESC